jgi:hypothetical protein
MSQAGYEDIDRAWMQKMADKGRHIGPVVRPAAIDDRDLVAEGFACSDCGEPFDDGPGHPRLCKGCGGIDESRHDELSGR